jgi:orotidine-5'-phosphate decarboxylase
MDYSQLFSNIKRKKSFLCIGLDTDYQNIPKFLNENKNPVFDFNKHIIDKTASFCVAYKPNIAFYEACGAAGWMNLQMTVSYIREKYPDIFIIADAKRADIGNSSKMYAKAFFEEMDFDAVTVNPYMGEDSISPFFAYKNKWVIVLALTSNPGATNFQYTLDSNSNLRLFERVIKESIRIGNIENLMFVVGATKAEMLSDIRKIIPDHFLLIPGIGAQGGSLNDVAKLGLNKNCGLLVNSSRNIIYADATDQFAVRAGEEAQKIQAEMGVLLKQFGQI